MEGIPHLADIDLRISAAEKAKDKPLFGVEMDFMLVQHYSVKGRQGTIHAGRSPPPTLIRWSYLGLARSTGQILFSHSSPHDFLTSWRQTISLPVFPISDQCLAGPSALAHRSKSIILAP